MSSPFIAALRSVALTVPDLARAEQFYVDVWHLAVVQRGPGATYLRGSGRDHHLLSLHEAAGTAIRNVTLRARTDESLQRIAESTVRAGGTLVSPVAPVDEPGGG